MKNVIFLLIVSFLLAIGTYTHAEPFTYHWEIDETPSGVETVSVIQPVEVTLFDNPVQISSTTASLQLRQQYGIHLSDQWNSDLAQLLLSAFESVPRYWYHQENDRSYWTLTDNHIHNDIMFFDIRGIKIVVISSRAFDYAEQRLAEIDGIRGRFFSRRLHRTVVRYITDNGTDRGTVDYILRERYAVSVNPPSYEELTKNTTAEHAGRFMPFKSDELMELISMLEEYPTGMLKTPGLNYIIRRLDGLPHPLYPQAGAVAWPTAGYIEFMESAFKGGASDSIHRLILHEKAHFLWHYLFDEQLKQDWIELGGWKQDGDTWYTTKQTEFVSAYAHGENPNEDMAESISHYIVRPDKLRSRSPAKYEFIQNRIMHGTRYISKIREDLTFEVYNLYPDYVYPGQIIRVDIGVDGEPEEDKLLTVEIEIHGESEFDTARSLYVRLFPVESTQNVFFDMRLGAIDENGNRVSESHTFRGQRTVSKYAKNGYWSPENISLEDKNDQERHQNKRTFGWQCYINNPLEDLDPPEYVKGSMELSLSERFTRNDERYQVITATWEVKEKSGIDHVCGNINDEFVETYSRSGNFNYGNYNPTTGKVSIDFEIPDYMPSGRYEMNRICMRDVAYNGINIFFTNEPDDNPSDNYHHLDETPKSIVVKTTNPDLQPPMLDINRITISAVPTVPEAPNGETTVDISFFIKDNISGYRIGGTRLRDPHGTTHHFWHYHSGRSHMYPTGDPTIYKEYNQRIILPVGSIPGTWGLAEMTLFDRAENFSKYDFTEIVRFEIGDTPAAPELVAESPQITQLMSNYPNPFNPETWIPYQLAKGSEISISIYATDGQLVRNLNLGYQPTGVYKSRSRAAYWDGRNGLGEPVASGVYFYTLTARDFTDTRKMLILK